MSIAPTFKVRGAKAVSAILTSMEKQSRFGVAKAITKTAKDVERELKREMATKTDRPTPYFLKSTFVQPATKQRLMARVGLKDKIFGKNGIASADMFLHHFQGGARVPKALEKYLRASGLLGGNEFIVPGAGARLDAFGNMSRGQVQQIISQLRLGLDPYAWSSGSRRSKRNVKLAGRIFWARGNERDGHLKRGAYIDMGPPIGLRPLLVVVRSPSYKRRFDLPQLAAITIAKTWKDNLNASLVEAFNTAK
jgi:hypothetical protein